MLYLYLDSSALFKRYRLEPGSAVVEQIFSGSEYLVATSSFTILEVVGVAARLRKGGILSNSAYRALSWRLEADSIDRIGVVAIEDITMRRATDLAARYAVKAGDALQLAAVLEMSRSVPDDRVVFVTGDSDLLAAAAGEGVSILDPQADGALERLTELSGLPPTCPHTALIPRWENVDDLGKKDLVSIYICSACGSVFSREEGAAFLGE